MDRYKTERIEYAYNWIDVGPGPSEKGATIDMGWLIRNYRKTHTTLEDAIKRLKEMQLVKFASEYVIIISKFVGNKYIPGKVTIPCIGKALWEPMDEYKWWRMNTKFPAFRLNEKRFERLERCIVSQWQFLKKSPPLAELAKMITMAYSDILAECILSRSISHIQRN